MAVAGGTEQLEEYLAGFVARLDPGQRKKLGLRIATLLQRARAKSIGANVDPDGHAFEPRKPRAATKGKAAQRKAKIKYRKMFLKARTSRFLRKEASTSEARIGFAGNVARVMKVHQEGLEDAVSREAGAPVVRYPVRRLLGLNDADREAIRDLVLEQLAE